MPANFQFDWGAIGVIGGGIFAAYNIITQSRIQNAVGTLHIVLLEKLSEVNAQAAIMSTEIIALEKRVETIEETSRGCRFNEDGGMLPVVRQSKRRAGNNAAV
jgi:hypothetical protein